MLWLICNDCGRTFAPDEGLLPGDECPSDDCPSHDDDEEQQMKIKTNELSGRALDWAVAKCEGKNVDPWHAALAGWLNEHRYSTDWAHGGPVIEREGIELFRNKERDRWYGTQYGGAKSYAPAPLVAAMRAYVAGKLGDVVDVPKELTK